jgi:hypothetical protein
MNLIKAIVLALVCLSLLAGCGGGKSFDWSDVRAQGDRLVLPNGKALTVRVVGTIPPACDFDGPLPPLLDKCLPITIKHGCAIQTFRIDETNEPFRIEPLQQTSPLQSIPPQLQGPALLLVVPVAPYDCLA